MSTNREGLHLPLALSLEDPEPMYRQIETQLRELIVRGQLPPGTPLPTIRALAQDLACSVITTRRAYQDLETAGLIRTRQGVGTVVAEVGEAALRDHRLTGVLAAFGEAVAGGLRLGYTADELRAIFERALATALARENGRGEG